METFVSMGFFEPALMGRNKLTQKDTVIIISILTIALKNQAVHHA